MLHSVDTSSNFCAQTCKVESDFVSAPFDDISSLESVRFRSEVTERAMLQTSFPWSSLPRGRKRGDPGNEVGNALDESHIGTRKSQFLELRKWMLFFQKTISSLQYSSKVIGLS